MSTYVVLALLLASAGCVDPAGRLKDFSDRVPDAGVLPDRPPTEVVDITGRFLLAIDPKPLDPGNFIRFIANATMTENAGAWTLDLELRPLDFQTLEEIPGATPISLTGLTVDPVMGTFSTPLNGEEIPAEANPIIPSPATILNGSLSGSTVAPDFWCGDITGKVMETGSSLDGSTFAARVTQASGLDLPPPVGDCASRPGPDLPDAGVPDIDASPPPIDASPPPIDAI